MRRVASVGPTPKPPEERFWPKVQVGAIDECWPWVGGRTKSGYGTFGLGSMADGTRRGVMAHRFSYELHNGPIPDGLFVCHHCDNPPCVNPAHLFAAPPRMNTLDMHRKGRGFIPVGPALSGEESPASKLTESQVIEMRALYEGGEHRLPVIAMRFGVSKSNVHMIVKRKTWRHLA